MTEQLSELSFDEMYRIYSSNNEAFNGLFFMCVKTTKIYCSSSCKAKLPYRKNVEFVFEKGHAIIKGYRGCKRCRSEFYPNTEPDWFKPVKTYLIENMFTKIREEELEKIGNVNISTIRRYFKHYLLETPSSYHRKKQLKHAYRRINKGEDYRNILFEYGYESVSGFRTAFHKEFGHNVGLINGK
ncbi:MAG: methylphosphotriester-DNA--protein-cysteine methyltransferase family protein [Candidatus Heimdallarchaeota archaeon]|nr:methylphosphotriester-DNA--protein-cysteine methyltransferase family protein [Candidatus Heimdallarchaeota archaeon]